MQNNSKIESFFNSLNINWVDFLKFLPIGVIFFDDYWKIKAINENFINHFGVGEKNINFEGINLFSRNILSEKLPLKDVLSLREGKSFESTISFVSNNDSNIKLLVKGSPIIKNNLFYGGTLTVEKCETSNAKTIEEVPAQNSLAKFLAKISNCFVITDLTGIIQLVSAADNVRLNFIEQKNGLNISEVFTSESQNTIKNTLQKCVDENKSHQLQLSIFSEKEKLYFNSVFLPLTDDQNEVKSIVLMLREKNIHSEDNIGFLTETNKLKEFEIFANADYDGLFKINLLGSITYWTESAEKLFGYSPNQISSKFINEIFPEINQKQFEQIRIKLLENNIWEGFLTRNNSHEVIIKVKIISKKVNNETNLYVYCKKIDLQQQKVISFREEEKLFFKDAVIKSNQMILQASPTGTILFANEKFCTLFEYDLDEIRGKHFIDLIEYDFKVSNNITEFEQLINRDDFDIIPFIAKSYKRIELCLNINISTSKTDLKYFTVYLNECNKKNKLLLDTAFELLAQFPKPIFIVHGENIIKVNPKFGELFGSDFESDYFNYKFKQIVDNVSVEKFNALLKSSPAINFDEKLVFIKKDRTKFEANIKKLCCAKDQSYSVLMIDQEIKTNITLLDKEPVLKNQFKNLGPFYWSSNVVDNKIVVEKIDSAFLDFLGYSNAELFNENKFWLDIIHPDDIENLKLIVSRIISEVNPPKEINFRIINRAGETVWFNNQFKKIINKDNSIKIIGALADVTKWVLEREELKSIINELDKLNTAKDKFISIISHDLKSPFTSIVGFSELILTDTTLEKDEIIEYVGHIKDASLHTVDLLNSLLDLTKLQTGRIEVRPKIINANYITNKTVEILSGLAFQKELSLTANVDNSLYLNVDENLIFQVFNNMVANSIKFTPKGGKIEILARKLPDEQKIEFTVKDNGVGIEQGDIDKLFVIDKKFTTLGTDGEVGTGLGLSLVKEIIDKHNGEIYVKSELGKGTEFIFKLPISSPSILIVDGAQTERTLYSRLLESITQSIKILQAQDEEEAINIIKDEMPMLIIFENKLPNMSGFDFIEELNKEELIYRPSLMVLTKDFSKELKQSYKNVGIEDVFKKPFVLKEFKERIDSISGKPF